MLTAPELFRQVMHGGKRLPPPKVRKGMVLVTDNTRDTCVFCGKVKPKGHALEQGEIDRSRLLLEKKQSFNDTDALSFKGRMICEDCNLVLAAKSMGVLRTCLITKDRFTYFAHKAKPNLPATAKHQEISAIPEMLLTPPEPPFVWLVHTADTNAQHLAWKARVSLDRDIFFVQQGPRMLTINRADLCEKLDALHALCTDKNLLEKTKAKEDQVLNSVIWPQYTPNSIAQSDEYRRILDFGVWFGMDNKRLLQKLNKANRIALCELGQKKNKCKMVKMENPKERACGRKTWCVRKVHEDLQAKAIEYSRETKIDACDVVNESLFDYLKKKGKVDGTYEDYLRACNTVDS